MSISFAITESLKARFWAKVSQDGDGCWLWTAAQRGAGYGSIKIEGKVHDSHRVAWILHNGTHVPAGQVVMHTCDNRSCCRPDHLQLGTYSENYTDAISKGRVKPFRPTRTEPLSRGELVRLRDEYTRGVSRRQLSRKFNVAPTTLTRILGSGAK